MSNNVTDAIAHGRTQQARRSHRSQICSKSDLRLCICDSCDFCDLHLVESFMDQSALALPFAQIVYEKGPYLLYGEPKVCVKNLNHLT